jgi:hypothetical protein
MAVIINTGVMTVRAVTKCYSLKLALCRTRFANK